MPSTAESTAAGSWRLNVLGPIELVRGDQPLVTRRQVRILLGWLALHRDGVGVSRLVELTWGSRAPAGASRQVVDLLRFDGGGPAVIADGRARLDHAAVAVDEDRFTELAAGSALGRAELEAALGLWRGPAYDEIADHPDALAGVHRLTDLRETVLARLYAIRLLEPDASRVVVELTADAARHPASARLGRLLAAGLAMTGRRIEALRTARAAAADDPARRSWSDDLEAAIQDDDLDAVRAAVEGFEA